MLWFVISTLASGVAAFAVFWLTTFHELKRSEGKPTSLGYLAIACAVISLVGLATSIGDRFLAAESERRIEKERTDQLEATISAIKHESERLGPADFQIRLFSMLNSSDLDGGKIPVQIHATGYVTKKQQDSSGATFSFELTRAGNVERSRAGRGGGGHWNIRFAASNMTIMDLWQFPYLQDLKGKDLHLSIPLKQVEIVNGGWQHHVDVYIKGRHFKGMLDEGGHTVITLNFSEAK